MTELAILLSLTPGEYKLYKYFVLKAGERKVINVFSREEILADMNLSKNSFYKHLTVLEEKHLIEYDGIRKFIKVKDL